jgi:hypothetical protein
MKRCYSSEPSKSQEDFRANFVTHIHTLTGVKPRLVLEASGKYAIYYS